MHVLKCTILQDKLGLTSEDHDGYGSSFVAVWDRPDVPDQNDEQAVKAWNDYLEDLEELDRCYLLSMMSKENKQRLDIPDAILDIKFADAGATRMISAHLASFIWPISDSSDKLKISE